jgi:hypothetical protein
VTVQQHGPPGLPAKFANPAETPLRADIPEGGAPNLEVVLRD